MAIGIHNNNNNDMYCDVAADALAVLTMGGGEGDKEKARLQYYNQHLLSSKNARDTRLTYI